MTHQCEQKNCKHESVKYCKDCQKVYCVKCGKEWTEPCQLNHYQPLQWVYPYQPTVTIPSPEPSISPCWPYTPATYSVTCQTGTTTIQGATLTNCNH